MKCPDIKSKTFSKMRESLGTKIAYNSFVANGGYDLNTAPNGNPSLLFSSITDLVGEDEAYLLKASLLTEKSKNWMKDSLFVDDNGEPKILYKQVSKYDSKQDDSKMILSYDYQEDSIPVISNSKNNDSEFADSYVILDINNIQPLMTLEEYDYKNNKLVRSVPAFTNGDGVSLIGTTEESVELFSNLNTEEKLMNPTLYSGNDNKKLNDEIMNSYNRRLAGLMVKTLSFMFQDITFVNETNNSTAQKVGDQYKNGWVDSSGAVHVNMDRIEPTTAIHELGHILEPLLEKKYPNLYKSVMDSMQSEIDAKSGVYSTLYNEANKDSSLETHKQRMSEVFAEGLAITTLQQLDVMLNIAGDNVTDREAAMNRIDNDFTVLRDNSGKLWNDIFNDKKFSTMEDLGFALANSIVNQDKLALTDEDMNLLNSYYKKTGAKYQTTKAANTTSGASIKNGKEMMSVLRDGRETQHDLMQQSINRAEALIRNKKPDTNITIKKGQELLIYDSNISVNELANQLHDSIYKPLDELRKDLKNKIVATFDNENFDNSDMYELFGEFTSENTIDDMITTIGLDQPVQELMLYSDLKNSTNPILKGLHSESFDNENTLVVVHSTDDITGSAQISLISLSPYSLIEESFREGDQNIFSKYMDDKTYTSLSPDGNQSSVVRMKNTEADIAKLNIAMTASSINEKFGDKITFNNLGVINIAPYNIETNMITDLVGITSNLTILANSTNFLESLENKEIERALLNGVNVNNESLVSYMGLLRSHLLNITEDTEDSSYFKNTANDLITRLNDTDIYAKLKVLDAMKSAISNNKGAKKKLDDVTYMMIAQASREIRTGKKGSINDLEDISDWARKLTTMYHMKSDYVQDVVTVTQESNYKLVKKAIKDIRKIGGTRSKPGAARKVLKDFFKKNPRLNALSRLGDVGSKVYEHLYKTSEVNQVDRTGKVIGTKTVKMPEMHWDKNNSDTKKALENGTISELDLELSNEVLDIMKQRWIEYIYHRHHRRTRAFKLTKPDEYSMNDAEDVFNRLFHNNKGQVPMIEKSVSEILLSGDVKKAAKKGITQLERSEDLFEDVEIFDKKKEDDLRDLGGFFIGQIRDKNRLAAIGLKTDKNGELVLFDEAKNDNASTDIWKTFNYFNQSVIRKIEYENNVIPVAEDSVALLNELHESGSEQHNNLRVIKEFINRNAYRQNEDKPLKFKIAKQEINAVPLARGLKGLYNKVMLPLRFSIGAMSMMFNVEKIITEGLTATITDSKGTLPKIQHFLRAAKLSFTKEGASKLRSVALNYNIWGRTERELLSDPFINITERSILNNTFANIFNWATDTWARSVTMAAVMMEDGSWDAHEYNEESGDVEYDEKKDLRFYNPDGSKKTDAESIALYNGIMADVMNTEGLKVKPSDLPMGYGMTDAIYMKQLADTRIIGAFSDDAAALIANNWLGNLFMQYRNFATVRMFNAGMFANTRKSSVGQRVVAVQDPQGNWISQRDVRDLHGALQSFGEVAQEWKGMNPDAMSQTYDNLSDTSKESIVRTMIRMVSFMIAFGILKGLGDDDDEYSKKAWEYYMGKMVSDLFIANSVVDMLKNPLPAASITNNIFEKGKYENLIPFSYTVKEYAEYASDDNES